MSMGVLAKLAIDTTIAVGSPVFEFLSEDVVKNGTIIDTGGIRGTRSHFAERVRSGIYDVGGSIVLSPTPTELNLLLPWILGGTPVVGTPTGSTTFPLAEAVPVRSVLMYRVADTYRYDLVKVNRATFSAAEGEPIRLSLDLVGATEVDGLSFTPTGVPPAEAPFVMMDGVLTVQAAARAFKNISITIDNLLDKAFNNSVSASSIVASDRIVTVAFNTPFTAAELALYDQAVAGAAAGVVFTNGAFSLTFNFARLQFPPRTPNVGGKGEIPLVMNGTARKTGSTDEIVAILDLTP